jgi:hypothetical protein
MRVRAVLLSFATFSILLFSSSGAPQSPQRPNQPAAPQDSPIIRSTTDLVQVSVVVTDKKGQPITGLKKESFTVMDESSLQQIAFFSAESPAPVVATPRLPKNVYTNRYDLKGQEPGATHHRRAAEVPRKRRVAGGRIAPQSRLPQAALKRLVR